MAKLALVATLFLLGVTALQKVESTDQGPEEVEEWFKKLPQTEQKLSHLHFYFHDTLAGQNPTSVRVAQAAGTDKSPTLFGVVNMIDDPLREGPEPTSMLVGRAQGLYGSAGQEEASLLMAMTFVFTTGEFNGSTLSILGRNQVFHTFRELPIISGTGAFRLARGIATAKTYTVNITTGDAVVEYHVVVSHY